MGKWRFWDPSLQAPELTGTVRFYRVLLQTPSNLHLPWFSSISPSLVQVSLQKWSHRVPQDQQLQISGWMAAELSGLLFSRCCKSYPWLVGIGMSRSAMSFLLGSEASCPGITSLWSWSWSAGSGLQLWQLGKVGEAAGGAQGAEGFSVKVQNCSAKFVISAGNVWTKVFILSCIDPVIFQPQSFQLEKPGRENFSRQTHLPTSQSQNSFVCPKYFLSNLPSAGVEEGTSLLNHVSPENIKTAALVQAGLRIPQAWSPTPFLQSNFIFFVSLCSHLTELFHLCCFLDSLVPSHITAYSLLWEGCVRPGSIVWLMLPYAGNTRKDIGLCWKPTGVWNESSSSWILCSVARRMLRQLQSCIGFLDRSFCLCSALGSLCFHTWAIQSAELHNELLLLAGIRAIKIVHTWFPKTLLQINEYEKGCRKTFLPVCQSAPRLVLVARLLGRFLVRNWVFNLMIECSTAVPAWDTARAQSSWYTAQGAEFAELEGGKTNRVVCLLHLSCLLFYTSNH